MSELDLAPREFEPGPLPMDDDTKALMLKFGFPAGGMIGIRTIVNWLTSIGIKTNKTTVRRTLILAGVKITKYEENIRSRFFTFEEIDEVVFRLKGVGVKAWIIDRRSRLEREGVISLSGPGPAIHRLFRPDQPLYAALAPVRRMSGRPTPMRENVAYDPRKKKLCVTHEASVAAKWDLSHLETQWRLLRYDKAFAVRPEAATKLWIPGLRAPSAVATMMFDFFYIDGNPKGGTEKRCRLPAVMLGHHDVAGDVRAVFPAGLSGRDVAAKEIIRRYGTCQLRVWQGPKEIRPQTLNVIEEEPCGIGGPKISDSDTVGVDREDVQDGENG